MKHRVHSANPPTQSIDSTPRILIFRVGQLGDTLIALPAIDAIRRTYPAHRLVLLTDRHPTTLGFVSSWDVLGPTGWFDRVIHYDPGTRGLQKWRAILALATQLRRSGFKLCFNLAPTRSRLQVARDWVFFRVLAGVGPYRSRQQNVPLRERNGRLSRLDQEWKCLLAVVDVRDADNHGFRLPIPEAERSAALALLGADRSRHGVRLIAIGPGSKMAAKKWSASRFQELGQRLLDAYPDVDLVTVGGTEDAPLAAELCAGWGPRAQNLAGALSVYGSAAVLERCDLFIGNDSGGMHLAAMVGTPCVALFSARDNPGRWEPYGDRNIVLRHDVDCAGCMLETCVERHNECLEAIGVDDVFAAAKRTLDPADSRPGQRAYQASGVMS